MLYEIAARNVELSSTEQDLVREQVERLAEFYERIMGCRIVVEVPNRRMDEPINYHVRVDLTVPGGELLVSRQVAGDVLTAVQLAFEAARRRLQDYARVKRGQVKQRVAPEYARVARLFPQEGYGFLETVDGREIYFHANSVLNGGFERLEVGMKVRYAEELGLQGPQASTVAIAGGKARVVPEAEGEEA